MNCTNFQKCTCCAAVCYLGRDGPIPVYSQLYYVWVCKRLGGWAPCAFDKRCTVYITYRYGCTRSVVLCRAVPLEIWYALVRWKNISWYYFSEPSLLITTNEELKTKSVEKALFSSIESYLLLLVTHTNRHFNNPHISVTPGMVNILLKSQTASLSFLSFPGANPSVELLLREHSLLEDKPLFGLKTLIGHC